jgi:hypothetical protein
MQRFTDTIDFSQADLRLIVKPGSERCLNHDDSKAGITFSKMSSANFLFKGAWTCNHRKNNGP